LHSLASPALAKRRSVSGVDGCAPRDYAACLKLAERLEASQNPPIGAFVLDSYLCGNGVAAGCEASRRVQNVMIRADKRLSEVQLKRWQASCFAAAAAADCYAIGMLLDEGHEDSPDTARYFERGCDLGEMRACARLARRLEDGDYGEKDPARALLLRRRACSTAGICCHDVALWLIDPSNPSPDPVEARRLLTQECSEDHPLSCQALGRLLRDGMGGPVDSIRAAQAFEKACNVGASGGCWDLGSLVLARDKNAEAALGWYRRGCALGDDSSCDDVARDHFQSGRGAEAAAMFNRLCDRGFAMACYDLGHCLAIKQCPQDANDPAQRVRLFEKACDGKIAEGCTDLGTALWRGVLVPVDQKRAVASWRTACDLGDSMGCGNLAGFYCRQPDSKECREASAEACRRGVRNRCPNATTPRQGAGQDAGGQ